MPPGTWTQLPANGLDVIGLTGSEKGASGNMIGFSNQAVWDATDHAIRFIGGDHHFGDPSYRSPEIQYLESTNTWSVVTHVETPPITISTHGYGHNVIDPHDGTYYIRGLANTTTEAQHLARKPHGGAWAAFTSPASPSVYAQIGVGMTWWSGPLSGAGSHGVLMVWEQTFGSLLMYDPIANNWGLSIRYPSAVKVPDGENGYQQVIAYSSAKNSAIMGGASNYPRSIWRVDSNRSVTQLANTPISWGIGHANLAVDPTNGEFLVWGGGTRAFYEVDPAGSGTWTLLTASCEPPEINRSAQTGVTDPGHDSSGGGNDALISVDIPEYGVLAYVSAIEGNFISMYLYKHGGSAACH